MELHTTRPICGVFNSMGFAIFPTFQDCKRHLVSGHRRSCISVRPRDHVYFNFLFILLSRSSQGRPLVNLSISVMIADTVFSIVVEIIFLLQGKVFALLPIKIIAAAVNLVHQCLLHALYSFEYKWFSQGWDFIE